MVFWYYWSWEYFIHYWIWISFNNLDFTVWLRNWQLGTNNIIAVTKGLVIRYRLWSHYLLLNEAFDINIHWFELGPVICHAHFAANVVHPSASHLIRLPPWSDIWIRHYDHASVSETACPFVTACGGSYFSSYVSHLSAEVLYCSCLSSICAGAQMFVCCDWCLKIMPFIRVCFT